MTEKEILELMFIQVELLYLRDEVELITDLLAGDTYCGVLVWSDFNDG